MRNLFAGALMLLSLSVSAADGDKVVALTGIFVNKVIQMEGAPSAVLDQIAALSENPKFQLDSILVQFKKKFETEYAINFPFTLLPEQDVVNNEGYKAFVSYYYGPNSIVAKLYKPLLPEGYKFMLRGSGGFLKEENWDETKMLAIFPSVDGVIFIQLDYTIRPKIAIGGMGTAGIEATARFFLVNKKGERVFDKTISGMSKKTVGLVAGVPVMDLDKILPLCQSATDVLFIELDEKLPKLLKKIDKRF